MIFGTPKPNLCQICKQQISFGEECDDVEMPDVHAFCYDRLVDQLESCNDSLEEVKKIIKDLLDE